MNENKTLSPSFLPGPSRISHGAVTFLHSSLCWQCYMLEPYIRSAQAEKAGVVERKRSEPRATGFEARTAKHGNSAEIQKSNIK